MVGLHFRKWGIMAEEFTTICKHCKGENSHKVITHALKYNPKQKRGLSEFNSTQKLVTSDNPFKRFYQRVIKDYEFPIKPRFGDQTVKIETTSNNNKTLRLDQLDGRITIEHVYDVAVMVKNNHKWTRVNLVSHTILNDHLARVLQDDFKRLDYLVVRPGNVSELQPTGRVFLRGVLGLVGDTYTDRPQPRN